MSGKRHSVGWLIDKLMAYGPYLPMHITKTHPRPIIRVLGLALTVVWCLPAFAVVCLPVLALIAWEMCADVWAGD